MQKTIKYSIYWLFLPLLCGVLSGGEYENDEEMREIVFPRRPRCTTSEGTIGICRPLSQCGVFSDKLSSLKKTRCVFQRNSLAICCPIILSYTNMSSYSTTTTTYPKEYADISFTLDELNAAAVTALGLFRRRQIFVTNLVRRKIVAVRGTSVFWHARLFNTFESIYLISLNATIVQLASTSLVQTFSLSPSQAVNSLSNFNVQDTLIRDTCPPKPTCISDTHQYRTIDGTCNNVLNGDWGSVGISMQRLLSSKYEDGISTIRLSVDGNELPSARLISATVHPETPILFRNYTLLLMQWGQFLDHDLTHTPITKGPTLADITCCDDGRMYPADDLHPECLPISIPSDDYFFSEFGQECMDFVRSMPGIRRGCTFGAREQINQITSYIDGSGIYGSTEEEATELRSFKKGLLDFRTFHGKCFLPANTEDCIDTDTKFTCFHAGDSRVNEQLDLALMHTLWLRQHNRIAIKLSEINPHWDDERIYQETRKIVGAQIQHITYNEFLPIVLGRKFMGIYGLLPKQSGFFDGYRNDIDATIFNAFSTASYRFGHSLVAGQIRTFGRTSVTRKFNLSTTQFAPFLIYKRGAVDALVRGLTRQRSNRFDRFFTEEITNRLFSFNLPFGMDLISLNIQRGRDHGIPPYIEWREMCGLPEASSWEDLEDVMSKKNIEKLQSVYDNVEDIDLYVGGVSERPVADSILGPTFICINGKQFIHLKLGDRFYYENSRPSVTAGSQMNINSSFTEDQLDEIRKITLARVLCDNSDRIRVIQPLSFIVANSDNPRVNCREMSALPRPSLRPWEEKY